MYKCFKHFNKIKLTSEREAEMIMSGEIQASLIQLRRVAALFVEIFTSKE